MPVCPGERSRQDFCACMVAHVTSLAFQIHRYKVLFLAQDACTSCRYFSWSLHLENARIYWQAVRGSQKWRHQLWYSPSPSRQPPPSSHTHPIFNKTPSNASQVLGQLPSILHTPSTNASSCSLAAAMWLRCPGCLSAPQGPVQNLINYLMFAKHLEDEKNCNISKYHD